MDRGANSPRERDQLRSFSDSEYDDGQEPPPSPGWDHRLTKKVARNSPRAAAKVNAAGRNPSITKVPTEQTIPGTRELLLQQLTAARQDLATRTQAALEQMEHACMDSLQHMEATNSLLKRENERLNAENERLHGLYSSSGPHMGGTGESPALRNTGAAARITPAQDTSAVTSVQVQSNKATLSVASVMPPVAKRPDTPTGEEGPPTMSIPGAVAQDDKNRSFSFDTMSGSHEKALSSEQAGSRRESQYEEGQDGQVEYDDDGEVGDGKSGRKKNKRRSANQVFADADKMKAKVREAVMKKEYDVRNAYKEEGCFAYIAKSVVFDHLTLCIIFLNAIWIAVDMDWNTTEFILDAHPLFQVMEFSFSAYFSIELLIRFVAFREKKDCLRDAWFVFDSCLVLMMIFDTGVMTLVVWVGRNKSGSDDGGSSGFADPTILRLFRLLKLTRMARMIRLLRATPELMILIKGIVVAFRSVIFTLLLLFVFIYLFAILFKSLLGDTPIGEELFPSIPHAMLTLLLQGTLPDHESLVMQIWNENYLYGLFAIFFILMTSLTVMNMLVGVLVEVVGVVSTVEKEQMNVQFVYSKLQELLTTSGLDADGDMRISKAEFESLILNPKAARMVQEVGVDVVGLVDFSEYLFQNDATLSFPEFMDLVLQLRGSNTATVKDVVDLRKFISLQVAEVVDQVKIVKDMCPQAHPAKSLAVTPRADVAAKKTVTALGTGASQALQSPQWAAPRPPSSPSPGGVPNVNNNFDAIWPPEKHSGQLLDEEV